MPHRPQRSFFWPLQVKMSSTSSEYLYHIPMTCSFDIFAKNNLVVSLSPKAQILYNETISPLVITHTFFIHPSPKQSLRPRLTRLTRLTSIKLCQLIVVCSFPLPWGSEQWPLLNWQFNHRLSLSPPESLLLSTWHKESTKTLNFFS